MKAPSKFNHRLWLGIALASCILAVFTITLFLPKHDSTPTIYHHADGTFSLNQKDGPKVTPDDIGDSFNKFISFGTLRLVGSSKTLLSDWYPIIFVTAELGIDHYRFEVGDKVCNFHTPGGFELENDGQYSEIQFLEGINSVPAVTSPFPKTDVLICGLDAAIFKQVIDATQAHSQMGKTVTVFAENIFLYHGVSENDQGLETFIPRHPDFWAKHIQPSLDSLRSMF